MSKYFLFFLLILLSQNVTWAISGSIRGKVSNRGTGRNLAGAQIWVLISNSSQIRAQAISDDEGNFIIENLDNGTYDLEAVAAGQISQKIVGLQMTNNAIRLAYFKMNSSKGLMSAGGARAYQDSTELIYTYASLQARQNAATQSATASTQTLLDQPATGYVINSDDIQFRGYMSLLDLLRDVPEIEINENVETDVLNVISARGVSGSGRWLIMQDGIRINTMLGSDIVIAQNINIRHAARIEIIIGAASAVYGADAFSGVINIISREANAINGGELIASFGSFNETNNNLTFGVAKGDFSVLASASYFSTNSPNYSKAYPTQYQHYTQNYQRNGSVLTYPDDTVSQPLDNTPLPFAMPASAHNINLLFKYKNLAFGSSRFYESHSSSSSFRPELSPPNAENQYTTVLNNAFVQHDINKERWSLNTIAQFNYWYIDPRSNYRDVYSAYNRIYKFGYERSAFARAIFNYKINNNQQLTTGASFQYSNALAETADLSRPWDASKTAAEQNFYYTGSDTVDYTGRFLGVPQVNYFENRIAAGFFAQYQIKIKDKLDLIAGGRLDYIRTIHTADDFHSYLPFNTRVGLVYRPSQNLRLKLFYGSAFLTPSPNKVRNHYGSFSTVQDSAGRVLGLAPNFFKLPTEEDNVIGQNPRPELLQSVESSIIYTKNDFLISANAYYNRFSNFLRNELKDSVPFFANMPAVPTAQIVTSEGNGFAYGATLRVEYKLSLSEQTNLRFNTAYSFVNGQLQDPDFTATVKPIFTAQHTAKIGLGFQYRKFNLYLKGLYRSPSYQDAEQTNNQIVQFSNPAFFVVSAFANYQLAALDKQRFLIDIFVRARNITNAHYYHISSLDLASFNAVPQERFGIFGGVQLRFNR